MRRVFVDTNYFAAVLHPRDPLHRRALSVAAELASSEPLQYVTLLANLGEVLTFASNPGSGTRREAFNLVARTLSSPDFDVIHEDRGLFDAAFRLYGQRDDKTYSFIDCMAMITCRERDIWEVLTGDHDFEREGFVILL